MNFIMVGLTDTGHSVVAQARGFALVLQFGLAKVLVDLPPGCSRKEAIEFGERLAASFFCLEQSNQTSQNIGLDRVTFYSQLTE